MGTKVQLFNENEAISLKFISFFSYYKTIIEEQVAYK